MPSQMTLTKKIKRKVGPKFKVGDNVRISKYKNIFEKGCVPNRSEQYLAIEKVKVLCCGYMLLIILTKNKLLEHFTKKNCEKQFKKCLELKK